MYVLFAGFKSRNGADWPAKMAFFANQQLRVHRTAQPCIITDLEILPTPPDQPFSGRNSVSDISSRVVQRSYPIFWCKAKKPSDTGCASYMNRPKSATADTTIVWPSERRGKCCSMWITSAASKLILKQKHGYKDHIDEAYSHALVQAKPEMLQHIQTYYDLQKE